MKFICPESQNRVSLKCGSIDSGSVTALAGTLDGASAPPAGVSFFGIGVGVGVGASACWACAGIMHAAATSSHSAANRVVAALDLRVRLPISSRVQFISIRLVD